MSIAAARGPRAPAAGRVILLVPYGYRKGREVRDIECDGIVPTLLHAARDTIGSASTALT